MQKVKYQQFKNQQIQKSVISIRIIQYTHNTKKQRRYNQAHTRNKMQKPYTKLQETTKTPKT